jgi:dsRNA-specific ribonuclease
MWLNNYAQSSHCQVRFLDNPSGPRHAVSWEAIALVNECEYGRAVSPSRGSAREEAARQAYERLAAGRVSAY